MVRKFEPKNIKLVKHRQPILAGTLNTGRHVYGDFVLNNRREKLKAFPRRFYACWFTRRFEIIVFLQTHVYM